MRATGPPSPMFRGAQKTRAGGLSALTRHQPTSPALAEILAERYAFFSRLRLGDLRLRVHLCPYKLFPTQMRAKIEIKPSIYEYREPPLRVCVTIL